jgi:NADP-dependent 3-hydroxy acid dehydrogenase YdfG
MLAERGAKVVIGARGLDRLETLARRIGGAGGEVAEFTDCPICLPIVNAPP